MPIEAVLTIGYALLLGAVAAVLEWTARVVHARSQQFKTAGFIYHQQLDVWRCPTGQHLHRQCAAPDRASIVYRAPAHVCNGCAAKASCTDSDQGRTLEAQPEAWVNSAMARFHRGLSLALLLLADLMLGVETARMFADTAPAQARSAPCWSAPWLLAALTLLLGIALLQLAQRFFAAHARS